MQSLIELQRLAMELNETDRAVLAAHRLASLPAVLDDDDEGLAEAVRRADELNRKPDTAISLEELQKSIRP
jgi:hypothetical protein